MDIDQLTVEAFEKKKEERKFYLQFSISKAQILIIEAIIRRQKFELKCVFYYKSNK